MKLVHFAADNQDRWGVLEGDRIVELEGSVYEKFRLTHTAFALASVKILPTATPSKIIGVGLNYRDHAEEVGLQVPAAPQIFLKAPSALIGHEDAIVLPFVNHEVHHEAELAFVVKRRAKNVEPGDALGYVLGYTCGNDVSDRTIQWPDSARSQAKSADTFAPLGPYIVTDIDPSGLRIECRVNGQLRQSSNTDQLAFDVPTLLAFLSRTMTLLPGDVVMTGTPSGIGPIHPGDVVEVCIEGIGTLRNPVRAQ
jgi:2-keto-4-pentenoate hydratase/2-oxohepta-3-ene-1,7-dioic acid hydratase in catechol pathway